MVGFSYVLLYGAIVIGEMFDEPILNLFGSKTFNQGLSLLFADGVGKEIAAELEKRIMILDGAMGTMIQSYKLQEEDFRGEAENLDSYKSYN